MYVLSVKFDAFYIKGWVYYSDYSNYVNTGHAWYSNGPKVSGFWMLVWKLWMVVWKRDKKCLFYGLKCSVCK